MTTTTYNMYYLIRGTPLFYSIEKNWIFDELGHWYCEAYVLKQQDTTQPSAIYKLKGTLQLAAFPFLAGPQ